jgi:hypothetical protein
MCVSLVVYCVVCNCVCVCGGVGLFEGLKHFSPHAPVSLHKGDCFDEDRCDERTRGRLIRANTSFAYINETGRVYCGGSAAGDEYQCALHGEATPHSDRVVQTLTGYDTAGDPAPCDVSLGSWTNASFKQVLANGVYPSPKQGQVSYCTMIPTVTLASKAHDAVVRGRE